MCFWGKTCNFWIYHTTHVLPELFRKSILPLEIKICSIFFAKHKVVPLGFFSISIKTLNLEKTYGPTFCLVKKKQYGISNRKIDSMNNSDKTCSRVNSKMQRFFPKKIQLWMPRTALLEFWSTYEKIRSTTLCFVKKWNKMGFRWVKSNFWTILIKVDVIV